MVKLTTAILTLFLFFMSSMTVLSANEKVAIVVDNSYPPYMYHAEGHAKGLYPMLIQAIFTRMGIEVDVRPLPWKRALMWGENGKAAIGGIYKNDKRLKIYDYSESIFEEKLVLFVKKGNAFNFKGLSDLKGKRVGLNLGWSYGQEFDKVRQKKFFLVQEAKDNWANLQKLIKGRVDCVVVDQLSASQIIHHEILGDKIEELAVPVAVNTAHIVFAKNIHKRKLLNRFDITLAKMKKDGSYSKTIEAFLRRNYE